MKNNLFILCSFFSITNSKAQIFEWAKNTTASNGQDYAYAMDIDNSGNICIGGIFSGTGDFDPGPGTVAGISTFSIGYISKFDPDGNLIWNKHLADDSGVSEIKDIAFTSSGDIYVVGNFQQTIDFDFGPGVTNLTSAGSADIFILKLDGNGNFIWVKQMSGINALDGTSIEVDVSGNIGVAGHFYGTADFNPEAGVFNLTSAGQKDFFVVKLSSAGSFIWAKRCGSTYLDECNDLCIDNSGNFYLTGWTEQTIDFDPGPGVYNVYTSGSTYVLKLNSNGDFIYVRNFIGAISNEGFSMKLDNTGSIYIGGGLYGTTDFDPGPGVYNVSPESTFDGYVVKLNSSGNFEWAQNVGGSDDDQVYNLALDGNNNVYLTGYFSGTVDFDKSIQTAFTSSWGGSHDIFICILSSDGTFQRVRRYGQSSPDDQGRCILLDTQDNLYTFGNFGTFADFNHGVGVNILSPNTYPNRDHFLQKLSPCNTIYHQIMVTACDSFAAPSGNYVYLTSGTYYDTIYNQFGCDSILEIDLQLYFSEDTSVSITACDQFQSPSGNYIWTSSGIYFDTLNTLNGCDSIIEFDLTIQNSTSSLISLSECFSFLSPGGNLLTSTGIYNEIIPNSAGCDSSITIDLSITGPSLDVDVIGNILVAQQSGAAYKWLACDNGFSPVPFGTGQSFTVAAPGIYAVEVTKNGCKDTSACFSFLDIGISSMQDLGEIKIYPVPFSDNLNLQFQQPFNFVKIIVLNQLGQIVYEENFINSENIVIELGGEPGIYNLWIQNDEFNFTQRIIKL